MTRTAHCSCGALRIEADGEPVAVVACSCLECQRRTGSVLGVGAYYPEAHVRIVGTSTSYVRIADSGHPFTTRFCPTCGTSLCWTTARNPGTVGIAVGAFADRDFPRPTRSVYEQSKHPWIVIGDDIQGYRQGRDSERTR